MLEKQLKNDFADIFKGYQIWCPNDRTAGWPDRGVQISLGRIVWFELKMAIERFGATTFRVDLSPAQAAWLAKWQRGGGHCFLFLGLLDYDDMFSKYGILRCGRWDLWPKIPHHAIKIDQLEFRTTNKMEMTNWFKEYFAYRHKADDIKSSLETKIEVDLRNNNWVE